jgi:hypothetical protein
MKSSAKVFEEGLASSKSYRFPPRELDYDMPMRSKHSPPPNKVSLLTLSDHIETVFADEDSEELSQKSVSTNALLSVETNAQRTGIASCTERPCIVFGVRGNNTSRLDPDSRDDAADDVIDALSRKCIKSTNDSSESITLGNGSRVVSSDVYRIIDGPEEDPDSRGDTTVSIDNACDRESSGSRGEPEMPSIACGMPTTSKSDVGSSIWRDGSSGDMTKTGVITNLSPDEPFFSCAFDDIVNIVATKNEAPTSLERVMGIALPEKLRDYKTGANSGQSKFVRGFNYWEYPCLELKVGHPVNASYDSTDYIANSTLFPNCDERIMNDSNLSREVEHDSADAKYGELLVVEDGKNDELNLLVVETAVSCQLLKSNEHINSIGENDEYDRNQSSFYAATIDKIFMDSDLNDNMAQLIRSQANMMCDKAVVTDFEQQLDINTAVAAVNTTNSAEHSEDVNKCGDVTTDAKRFPTGFLEELVERATGLMAPSKTGKSNEASKVGQLPSRFSANTADFTTSVAMRASEVEGWKASPDRLHGGESSTQLTHSVTNTPKIMLIPLPQSSRSTPGSSFTGETIDEFLSDYW